MNLLVILFWIFLAILFYCWFGYGLLVLLFRALGLTYKNARGAAGGDPLPVTLLIAAYREDGILEEKIRNSLRLRYPLRIIVVIDGETGAGSLVDRYPAVKFIFRPSRKGKYDAIKEAMTAVDTGFVVFSDANGMLNEDSIEKIMSHYADPRTGAVAGEKRIVEGGATALGEAEGIYWRYESLMKNLDAAFYTVTGAAGEIYSIRSALFRPVDEDVVVDDLLISMQVCLQGYRIAYEPGAFSYERGQEDLSAEKERRVRIAAGVYQVMGRIGGALNFFKQPRLAFQFFSRRVLRWFVSPLLLPALFVVNLAIVYVDPRFNFYYFALALQILMYVFAFLGWLIIRRGTKAGWFGIPFYFVFMNYCMLPGFWRFLRKKQPAAWEKKER